MITVTSAEAQSRSGELIDRSQREPVTDMHPRRGIPILPSAAFLVGIR